ncbi:hypothetical protein Hanom_Chr07g00657021 [Helianthus anomalus]
MLNDKITLHLLHSIKTKQPHPNPTHPNLDDRLLVVIASLSGSCDSVYISISSGIRLMKSFGFNR